MKLVKNIFQYAVLLLLLVSCNSYANKSAKEFAEDVLLHVVLHEISHALVREFDLPVLGNEETMGDAFATYYVIEYMPDRALDVLTARVSSLIIESKEVPKNEWSVSGEHNNDARRAHQIAALAIAANFEKFSALADLLRMSESDISRARDYGTEIHRSWRRILKPLTMPIGIASREARVGYNDGNDLITQLSKGPLLSDVKSALTYFDWHSQITISFEEGNGGASWSRNGRKIKVFNSYIQRFIKQADSLPLD